ncbi:MAG: sigma-54-dependent transcriptional regulator [Candidatus Omnitrophota bacterium]
MIKILLIEDQPIMIKMLKMLLERHLFGVVVAPTVAEAAEKIEHDNFDVILLDLQLPDGNGIELFDRFPKKMESKTIIITSNVSVSSVVLAIKKGAFNYLEKPVDEELLTAQIRKIAELKILERSYRSIKSEVTSDYGFEDIVYESRQIAEIIHRAKILAQTDNAILIQGETGVGKDILSRSIHNCSNRKSEVFMPLNCASIPHELFESELFGFAKGAFTGAVDSYSGRLIQANKGTLFLDEIGELPLHIQAKLLRILEERVVYPLKSKTPVKIDIRLISATNKSLMDEVNLKQFRSDLYYRLKESTLYIPPLRERADDILPLIRHFIRIYNHVYNKNITKISRRAENYFLNYSWKGNVRELKNLIKSMIPFKKNDTLDLDDLSYATMEAREPVEKRYLTLDEHEKKYIHEILKVTNYNISQSSKLLGINRPRLYRKLKQFNLEEALVNSEISQDSIPDQ